VEDLQQVRDVLTAGVPPLFDLSSYVARVYDQETVPACTCYSAAAMQSIFEAIEREMWIAFDALECYRALGGNGQSGIDPRAVLTFMQQTGLLATGTSRRYRIGSYAFVQLGSQGRLDLVKAALAANRPAVLALRLPADWGANAGQSAGGASSWSGHQVCLTGYDQRRLYFVNSQGTSWGDNGFGSIPADFVLRPEQDGWSFAYTAIDQIDDDLMRT
jgi:hypothetical protein